MVPLLPIAMGLLEVAPMLAGFFKGKKAQENAEKIVNIAKVVTGKSDPTEAITEIKGDPAKILEFKSRVLDASLARDIAEYAAEGERFRDIRESGELSRAVRPTISLTFHAAIWGLLLFKPVAEAKALISIVLFTWGSMTFTIGAAYVLIIAFYFLTKGIKDYFMSKNPAAGLLQL